MDMKKILQALDNASLKPVVDSNDMKKFVSIVREGRGPLNRPTVAETLTMQHYTTPKKTITAPVLNVAEGAQPSMIGKYFKAVEQELREAAERPNERATQLAKRVIADMNEGWSQKYKSSINCSHPKGFSQKAHCAGKKKHNESMMTMEMTCPDCGMCKSHSSLNEIAKGAKDSNGFTKCWPGKHAEGTKKGKNGGQVRNCVPNESVGEAANPAQQAAIAIAKKKAGKK